MPTTMYIEDDDTRLTLLSAQPLGAASLREGQIEVMQDRRLLQDDNRGLDQGVMDNRPTLCLFRLLVEEPKQDDCGPQEPSHTAASYAAVQSLNSPLHRLLAPDPDKVAGLEPTFRSGTATGASTHLVSLSVVNSVREPSSVGLIIHRTRFDQCFSPPLNQEDSGRVNVSSLLSITSDMTPTSLSFLYKGTPVSSSQAQDLCPFSILAFLIPKQSA
ncbi:Alpha-mannosidase 2 [Homalodisca vitripennis]|nr:Alpha-mannosidase 2 [Homalodisca vitripennis]